jgi:hypothetical protein
VPGGRTGEDRGDRIAAVPRRQLELQLRVVGAGGAVHLRLGGGNRFTLDANRVVPGQRPGGGVGEREVFLRAGRRHGGEKAHGYRQHSLQQHVSYSAIKV